MQPDENQQRDVTAGLPAQPRTFDHTQIAECAYHLWMSQGCPEGRAEAIWLEAEALLLAHGTETMLPSQQNEVPEPARVRRERVRRRTRISPGVKHQRG